MNFKDITKPGTRRVITVQSIAEKCFLAYSMPLDARLGLVCLLSDFLSDHDCDAFCIAAGEGDQETMGRIADGAVEYAIRAVSNGKRGKP